MVIGLLVVLVASPGHASLNIPNVPIQSSATVPPNIMFILDDSGSMHGEIMPGEIIDEVTHDSTGQSVSVTNIGRVFPLVPYLYGGNYDYANIVADPDNVYGKIVRTAEFNSLYYNPEVEYKPWFSPSEDTLYENADPERAYWNPDDTSKGYVNLTSPKTYSGVWWQRTSITDLCTQSACVRESGSREIEFNIYYEFTGGDKYDPDSYVKRYVTGPELNNFANWFQYYRSRILASRGGIGHAFSDLPAESDIAPRVGYATLNSSPRVVRGVRPFTGDHREAFYRELYQGVVNGNVGTPSRQALYDIGRYFETTKDAEDPWRTDVGDADGAKHDERLSCRQSFAMLMTDGYWSESPEWTSSGRTDAEASYPFYDNFSGTTLADVAYDFWVRDLRSDIANRVPTSVLNPQNHQHMVTYGIGLGVFGKYTPEFAFGEIGKSSGSLAWDNPFGNERAKVDDLLHAAVNSRGGFFTAADPESFSVELRGMLSNIIERTESGSNIAANSVRLDTETRVFQASYVGRRWTGELASFRINNGRVSSAPSWLASENLLSLSERKNRVFTAGGAFIDMRSNGLGSEGGFSRAEYLLGRTDGEVRNGGPFRNRASLLGDIVNSSPAFTAETTTPTIFVGANDGMLHAFNANTGAELYAYVPSENLIPDLKLVELTKPSYSHEFFVDGPVVVSSREMTAEKNLLIGTLGRGGPGVFGLDVTSPASAKVNWEASRISAPSGWKKEDRDDLGLIINKPLIVRTNIKDKGQTPSPAMAIFGNGLNSSTGNGRLYIVNASTGELVKSIKVPVSEGNGITSIQAWDQDGDGRHDFVYAADIKGNIWKFDLEADAAKDWGLADGGGSGSSARASGGDPLIATGRPITGGLQIAFEPRTFDRWVFFGTGKYLELGDPSNRDQQRWYGIKDTDARVTSHTQLTARSIELDGEIGGRAVRAFQPHEALGAGSRGWYVDLHVPDSGGSERMVSDPLMVGRVLVVASILPSSDPCMSGGTGYINAIDAFSGTATQAGFFDVDGDGQFDDDTLGGGDGQGGRRPVGSVDLDIAMPTSPTIVESLLIAGGSLGTSGEVGISNPLIKGRISWREIIGD